MFLTDALRRIRKITAGRFALDTWQMLVHILCFLLVMSSGIGLAWISNSLLHQESKVFGKYLYILLDCIIGLVFLAELPFLYIINRLVTQSLRFQKESGQVKVEPVTDLRENKYFYD